jgi:hypothetical protein
MMHHFLLSLPISRLCIPIPIIRAELHYRFITGQLEAIDSVRGLHTRTHGVNPELLLRLQNQTLKSKP